MILFKTKKIISLFLAILILIGFSFVPKSAVAVSGANFQFEIVNTCGNGIVDGNEQCDGSHLNGQTCISQGFAEGGILTCKSNCLFNTSECLVNGIGGSGGGGGGSYEPPVTSAIFEGRAYPNSVVTLLKDAQVATTTTANSDANFQMDLSDIAGGNYTFSLYGEDNNGNHSPLLTFSGEINAGAVNRISGIYIAPTIVLDKTSVKRGDNILISGQSYPNSIVSTYVDPVIGALNNIHVGTDGKYSYSFNSSLLNFSRNFIKTKSSIGTDSSSFSTVLGLDVGDKNVLAIPQVTPLKGDLNGDGKVNLVDFSIAAYWYKKPETATFRAIDNKMLSGDGVVDLTDFSIMAYYWTG